MLSETPVLAVIGGSGLYDFPSLEKVETIFPDTPFGKPSAPITLGTLSGKRVAFLARHGIGHTLSPSEVPYRANIFALKTLGVERIISVSACGSLREDFAPGEIVIPDQLFDHTRQRVNSFFGEGLVVHISPGEPFCPDLSTQLYQNVSIQGVNCHLGGAMITIEGPRFFNQDRIQHLSLVGYFAHWHDHCTRSFLAREAEICYAVMAHVTDYDVWHAHEEDVTVDIVVNTLKKNTDVAQRTIQKLVENLREDSTCNCQNALENAFITHKDAMSPATIKKLGPLVNRYLK